MASASYASSTASAFNFVLKLIHKNALESLAFLCTNNKKYE